MCTLQSVLTIIALLAFAPMAATTYAEDRAALSSVLNKKYKMVSSDNFDGIMKALGVGWFLRKMGNMASPVIDLTEKDGEFSLYHRSFFKDVDIRFRLGEEFDEETADGRMVRSLIVRRGNVLIHTQKDEDPEKNTTIVRTFTPEEIKVVYHVGDVVCTRIYKPQCEVNNSR